MKASATHSDGEGELTYPVLRDAGLLVRVVALDYGVVIGGGAGGQALLRLVASCAVSGLVGVKSGRGVFLVEGRDGGQQLLNEDKDLNGSLGDKKKDFLQHKRRDILESVKGEVMHFNLTPHLGYRSSHGANVSQDERDRKSVV